MVRSEESSGWMYSEDMSRLASMFSASEEREEHTAKGGEVAEGLAGKVQKGMPAA
jgi:hypothetical protein